MTSGIQRPSGGSPAGPSGPTGPDDPDGPDGLDGLERPDASAAADPSRGVSDAQIAQLAAALQSGSMRTEDALAALIDGAVGTEADPELATELRALMQELVATDPYLAGLARELGAVPAEPGAIDE